MPGAGPAESGGSPHAVVAALGGQRARARSSATVAHRSVAVTGPRNGPARALASATTSRAPPWRWRGAGRAAADLGLLHGDVVAGQQLGLLPRRRTSSRWPR